MRNIHQHIKAEYGLENVKIVLAMGKIGMKDSRFQNHRRFSLRCLNADSIPVSIRLRSNIRSPKGNNIIKGAEKALLNERIRMVNNPITMFETQIDTCMNWLKGILDKDSMEECMVFIKTRREFRHIKSQIRQVNKFNWLCHKIEVATQTIYMAAVANMLQNNNKYWEKQVKHHSLLQQRKE